jgi:PTS system mannose-specific IID component/fructoselysine and glucoselysine-specific PTS system IID component
MKNTNERLTRQDLWKIFRGQFFIRSALNFERMQNVGFTHAMAPIIEKYYDTPEEKQAAIDRHMQMFLTQPMVASIPIGVAAAMEERVVVDRDIESESIDATKTALMGPLAALGDSLINGTARPILAGIGCSLALAGSILGPIIFLIGMSIITLGVRYLGIFKGYEKGVGLVADLQKSGLINKITELASVAAYVVIGGFIVSIVSLNLNIIYTAGDATIDIQQTLDSLLPSLLPVLLTLGVYKILSKRKISAILLMLIIMLFGIAATYLGIM